MPVTFTSEFDCADAIITRVGKQLRVAQVNRNLPFVYDDAVVARDSFDLVLDDSCCYGRQEDRTGHLCALRRATMVFASTAKAPLLSIA